MPLLSYVIIQWHSSSLKRSHIILTVSLCFFSLLILLLYRKVLHGPGDQVEGCRRLGIRTHSDLDDEHNEHHSTPESQSGQSTWKIKSLWVYPIKSCRGVEVSRSTITGRGMSYDRQFSFAQLISKFPVGIDENADTKAEYTWKFITQRTFPAMANIKTEIWVPDPAYSEEHSNVQSEGIIILRFPFHREKSEWWAKLFMWLGSKNERVVSIPFNPTKEQIAANGYTIENMEIWRDNPPSLRIASTKDEISWIQDLQSYLGITNQLALFRVCLDHPREVHRCAPRRERLGYQSTVGFQDAYPLHILNLASIHNVAKKMEPGAPSIGARNFRPNIVIVGGDAFDEDSWKRVRVGKYEYYVACRTVRCLLPNVNPATGIRHGSEPNRTLKAFRRIDEGDSKNACLGMQMVPALEESQIHVGDTVTVLETGEHFYIKQ